MGDHPKDPWSGWSGVTAAPTAPRGGAGPGASSLPGVLSAPGNAPGDLPHPQSHAGKKLTPEDLKKKADGAAVHAQDAAPVWPVTLKEFNNKGKGKYVEDIKDHPMGSHPVGNFPFVNAVEIIFEVHTKLAQKKGLTEFRCRQRAAYQEMWEMGVQDGKLVWKRTARTGEEPDDPVVELQLIKPPIIAYHDAPGFMASTKDAQMSGPGGQMTSKQAGGIYLRQNFVGWIDGRTKRSKDWERVSEEVTWHSNQSLMRSLFGDHEWNSIRGTEIELGHTSGEPTRDFK